MVETLNRWENYTSDEPKVLNVNPWDNYGADQEDTDTIEIPTEPITAIEEIKKLYESQGQDVDPEVPTLNMWEVDDPETGERITIEKANEMYEELKSDTKNYSEIGNMLVLNKQEGFNSERPILVPRPNTEAEGFLSMLGISKEDIIKSKNFLYSMFPKPIPPVGFGSSINYDRTEREIEEMQAENPDAKATTGVLEKTKGAITDFAGEGAAFAGAIVDVGREIFNLEERDYTTKWSENLPEIETDSLFDTIVYEGIPVGISYMGGRGLLKKPLQESPKVLRWMKNTTKELLGVSIMAGTMETDTGGLFVGEDALMTIFTDLSAPILDPTGLEKNTAARKKLSHAINITADAIVASGILKGVTYPAISAYNIAMHGFISPIYNVFVKGSEGTKRTIVNDLLFQATREIPDQATAIDIQNKMVELIKENSEVILSLNKNAKEGTTITLDVASALRQGLNKKDEAGEFIIKGNQRTQLEKAINIFDQEIKKGGPQTKAFGMQGDVKTTLSESLDDITASASKDSFDESADIITQANKLDGEENLGQTLDQIDSANLQLDEATKNIEVRILDDLELGETITSLKDDVKNKITETGTRKADFKNVLSEDLDTAARIITDEKNRLYGLIKGGEVNLDDLYDIFKDLADKNFNQFDQANITIARNAPFSKIIDELTKTKTVGKGKNKKTVRKSDEEYKKAFMELMSKNKADFGWLYNTLRNDVVNLMYGPNADPAIKNALTPLKQYIDEDALEVLINSGDNDLVDKALKADTFYKEVFSKYFNDTTLLKEYYESWMVNARPKKIIKSVDDGKVTNESVGPLREGRYITETQRMLNEATQSPVEEITFQNLKSLLEDPKYGGSPKTANNLADYVLVDVAQKIESILRKTGTGNVDQTTVNSIMDVVETHGVRLFSAGFNDKATALNTFISKLNKNMDNKIAIDKSIKELTEKAKKQKIDLENNILSDFWKSKDVGDLGLDLKPVKGAEAEKVFENILKRTNASEAVDGLLKIADTNPIVLDALKSSFARYFNKRIFSTKVGMDNAPVTKASGFDEREIGIEQMFLVGKQIFSKGTDQYGPEVWSGLEELARLSRGIDEARLKATAMGSNTALDQQATRAVNGMVKLFLGPLTRPGAKVSAVTSSLILKLQPNEVYKILADDILSNPKEFSKLASGQIQWLTDETQDILWNTAIRTGLYGEDEELKFETLWNDYAVPAMDNSWSIVKGVAKGTVDFLVGEEGLMKPQ